MAIELFVPRSDISIRALHAISKNCCWFAANKGVFGYTTDAGKNWNIDSVKIDSVNLDFRSIAVINDSTVLILSTGPPAYLFKTSDFGKTWKNVYTNTGKEIFFDAFSFENNLTGYAIADPMDGQFQFIKTNDGGENWKRFSPPGLPAAENGEACFAASNSIFKVRGNNWWFVTGGVRTRLYSSNDGGNNFESKDIPLEYGGVLTGTFSFDTYDFVHGVFAGGHYEKSDSSIHSLAITDDAGKSFKSIKTPVPFFGSCVKYISENTVLVTGHHGTFIYDLIKDSWTQLLDMEEGIAKFNTLSAVNEGSKDQANVIWLAGNKGRIAKILLEK